MSDVIWCQQDDCEGRDIADCLELLDDRAASAGLLTQDNNLNGG